MEEDTESLLCGENQNDYEDEIIESAIYVDSSQ